MESIDAGTAGIDLDGVREPFGSRFAIKPKQEGNENLNANAKTPQDHERLAAYYRSQEQLAKGKQAEYEEMLRGYHENPLSHRLNKCPSLEYHCRTLIRIFGDEARKDATLAEYQDKDSERSDETEVNSFHAHPLAGDAFRGAACE